MSKISALPELTAPAATDELEVVDKSDTSQAASGTNKRMTWLTTITKIFASRFAVDAGSTDTYVVTLDPVPAAYVNGEHYRFKANTANTGACTVNFNGLGAKTIKKAAGGITTDLIDNDIRAGQWVDLVYDGTNMQMQSMLGNAPAGGAGGIGDVVGPASATDNALARYDTTTGKLIQDSPVTVDDAGAITIPEIAAPSTPAAGKVVVYAKSDNKVYRKGEDGVEAELGGGAASIAPLEIVDANTVRQINGVNAQTFRVHQDTTIFFFVKTVAGAFEIGSADANTKIVAGSTKYEFNGAALLTNTADIGSTSNRVGTAFANVYNCVAGGQFRFNGRGIIEDVADGWIVFRANSGTTAKISFGDTSATGAMLKRNSTRLESRLGDDSAYAQFTCEKLGVNNSAAATTLGSVTKKIEVFDAAGNSLGFIAVYDSIT